MSITDELAKLNELHQSGALTPEEYARAKAKLLGSSSSQASEPVPEPGDRKPQTTPSTTPKRKTSPILLVFLLAVLIGLLLLVLRRTPPQEIAKDPLLSAVASLRPVEVLDAVENLPANSMKGIPLTLPYSGTLRVEVQVVRGNPVDVYLVNPSEIESIKARKEFRSYQGFEASKTTNYKREGRLPSGTYDLVFVDQTLGIISSSTSDIRVQAHLEP